MEYAIPFLRGEGDINKISVASHPNLFDDLFFVTQDATWRNRKKVYWQGFGSKKGMVRKGYIVVITFSLVH